MSSALLKVGVVVISAASLAAGTKLSTDTMIPIGVMVSAIVGTGVLVWRVATLITRVKERLDDLERRIQRLDGEPRKRNE